MRSGNAAAERGPSPDPETSICPSRVSVWRRHWQWRSPLLWPVASTRRIEGLRARYGSFPRERISVGSSGGSLAPRLQWIASSGSTYRHAPWRHRPRNVSLSVGGSGVHILLTGYSGVNFVSGDQNQDSSKISAIRKAELSRPHPLGRAATGPNSRGPILLEYPARRSRN